MPGLATHELCNHEGDFACRFDVVAEVLNVVMLEVVVTIESFLV
jgi:hypothetical protein